MKHVVIDSRHLGSSTGVYMQNLLKHLNTLPHENLRFSALVPRAEVSHWQKQLPNITIVSADHKWYSTSEQLLLPWKLYSLRPNLVHFCMPQQPLLYIGKRVTTIHDLTLVRYENVDMNPAIYRMRKGVFVALLRNVIARSKAIITGTQFVRDDIVAWTKEKYRDKMTVTLEAGDPLASEAETVENLADKKFLFFVGNAFPYKNLDRIVDAYRLVKASHPDLQLVFAGKKDYFYEQIERRVSQEGIADVHILGFVSEGEKRWLFQNAVAYIVASLSEGFHIPGLEAMYEGCPVISSSATCLPEVYEDAALYFNPHDTEELAAQIETVITNTNVRKRLKNKGYKQVKKYSWRRMAEQTLEVYEKVLGNRD